MFDDRRDAGRQLAARCRGRALDVVVLGLPRGGVPVAFEIAGALRFELDVIVVRKLGVPRQPELAMGAIGEDGIRVVNDDVVRHAQPTRSEFDATEAAERVELARRLARYRKVRPRVPIDGRAVLIVDDGVATGATVRAACEVAKAAGASTVDIAAPVITGRAVRALRTVADEVIAVETPVSFAAIGQFYRDFSPTADAEVERLLRRAANQFEPEQT